MVNSCFLDPLVTALFDDCGKTLNNTCVNFNNAANISRYMVANVVALSIHLTFINCNISEVG